MATQTFYKIPSSHSGSRSIEVYRHGELALYGWRIVDDGRVVEDADDVNGRFLVFYGSAEVALRDALIAEADHDR